MENLKHIKAMGDGYFCLVKQYEDERTKRHYAVKALKKKHYSNEEYRYRIAREIQLLKELHGCEQIINLIDSGSDSETGKIWYQMPYADFNLFDYIKNNNSLLTIEQRFNIIEQIIEAIKYAHVKDILHRDISPNNVLVFLKGNKPIIKVADFGLGKDTKSLSHYTSSSTSGYGQILYVSPEQRSKLNSATVKSDIYSLGKLIYYVYTGKYPDNMQPCALSSLIEKAAAENPEDRFQNIDALQTHLSALKNLILHSKIPIEHLTLREVMASNEPIDYIKLHELLVKGNYLGHVYEDYISPVNSILLEKQNLEDYYKSIGHGIRDFVRTYSDNLTVCFGTTGWPFSESGTFANVLIKIMKTIPISEVRLICLKLLWELAFIRDQWSVQTDIKSVLNATFITKDIEIQFAEFIQNYAVEVDLKHFTHLDLPIAMKASIIAGNKAAQEEQEARRKQYEDDPPF